MKKRLVLLIALFLGLAGLKAMSYEEARDRARFLTDKMAYELNLNDQQYNDAYEINLDYLMSIRTKNDNSSVYLKYRNDDLRLILHDWQYELFKTANYFFRPVVWRTSGWFLPVYTIYSPGYFFYNPPRVYKIYKGGHHKYRHEHRRSFYTSRRPEWHGGLRGESRGPHPIRPAATKPNNGHGFRFEPNKRPYRPDYHNRKDFRIEQGKKPNKADTRPGKNGIKPNAPAQRPQNTQKPQPNRPERSKPATPPVMKSKYNRPSSTRTTVNRTPNRKEQQPVRKQATPKTSDKPKQQSSLSRPTASGQPHQKQKGQAASHGKKESRR